ncbi:YolD-like family protein [Brevibacillus sp. SYP-B805]|uniref:YolD-like family protein n=1 Tax=Brevibacillus sp. SYP-B805 TaxID=1578199 RepID=UPI0013EE1B75|nr:YolD-like family protein [Brevibacillus sp. SYP-B805]NGQ93836.1 YolD-like family protein [Brevibacillus sp. SYP-B805]
MRNRSVSKKENLFAASRFVLPEHRELYLRLKEEQRRYVPPVLDEEQRAELSERLWRALQEKREAILTYYDGVAARRQKGLILHVDQAARRFKLKTESDTLWIAFAAVLDVQPA